ncbi:MAG: restriction endonuclease subunit S [Bacteroidota bacterium]
MEMREGYKQTEIGIIPEDWDSNFINEISTPVRGGSPRPAGDPRFFNGNFIPWLTVASLTNIPESQINVKQTSGCLTQAGSLQSRILFPGTLIISNSGATLGVSKLLSIKCCANDGIAALLNVDQNVNKLFVVYYLNTKTEYFRNVVATGNGQPNLNTNFWKPFRLEFP